MTIRVRRVTWIPVVGRNDAERIEKQRQRTPTGQPWIALFLAKAMTRDRTDKFSSHQAFIAAVAAGAFSGIECG